MTELKRQKPAANRSDLLLIVASANAVSGSLITAEPAHLVGWSQQSRKSISAIHNGSSLLVMVPVKSKLYAVVSQVDRGFCSAWWEMATLSRPPLAHMAT